MPEKIVHGLEAIQVGNQTAEPADGSPRRTERLLQAGQDRSAVQQSRQGIVGREMLQFAVDGLQFFRSGGYGLFEFPGPFSKKTRPRLKNGRNPGCDQDQD